VLLGLLLILLLFHFQGRIADRAVEWNLPGTLLLAGILLVAVVNYLATRLAPSALLLAVALTGEGLLLRSEGTLKQGELVRTISWSALAAVPWLAYWLLRRRPPGPSEFDRIWLAFRDRFGLVWGQRVREQFNRAAENAGWSLRLRWQGLRILPGATVPDSENQREIVAVLQSMLKRFGREE
jgi:hypothetical protein